MLPEVIRYQHIDISVTREYASLFAIRFLCFFIALISIAAFGYLFNDLCDISADTRAGKPNMLARLQIPLRITVVSFPLLLGAFSWYMLNQVVDLRIMPFANMLLALQVIALVMYSAKPFRLKERAAWGALFDAFYGHLNPVLITVWVFSRYIFSSQLFGWFLLLLVTVSLIKGIRNILLHQIEDRKKDQSAQINTVVLKYGPWRVINFINHYLFPAEIFFLVCLTLVMSFHIPPLILPFMFFAIVSYLKFSGWKLGYADRRLVEFKFSYFMNDYYEGWLPVFMLVVLSVYRHEFVFLLILHLILFPMFIINLVRDFKTIRENFKTEEDY